jgi:MYXO-CTERM domain-containing protein
MLTRRRVALALTTVAALGSSAFAFHPGTAPSRARTSHDHDAVVLPAARVSRPLRGHVELVHQTVPARSGAAWQRLVADAPGMTQASWDRATGVPSRIWGRGVDAPGSVADPDLAAAAAWRFLVAHLELVAPGSAITDFELVANVERRGLRTIGFVQRHGGLPVFGGQVNFRFKNDRLFVVGSEALPDVRVPRPTQVRAATVLGRSAAAATALDLGLAADRVSAGPAGPLTIVPLVADDGVLGYRVAVPVEIDGGSAGRWQVFTDPASGEPLVRRSLTRFGAGTVAFDAVERWTGRPRGVFPAPGLTVSVGGTNATTGADGGVTWSGASPVTVMASVVGPLVSVENRAGSVAQTSLSLTDAGMGVWIPGDDRELDAQLSTYVHAHVVKEYARRFAGDLEFLDEQLPVRVNIDDECNAFSDGTSINFFRESDMCSNTGTIADVVYHEFGHSLHAHAIIQGVGFFDGAFSEGLSDYLSATILNDSGMGRGFFKTDAPLRELSPVGSEAIWPRDIAEIHTTGIIFGGTMWDLRAAMIEAKGYEAGVRYTDELFYAAVQRAPSIPATLIEVLAEDDDDGDLSNGTPNECIIRAAYGRHGMRTVGGALDAAGIVPFTTSLETFPVTLALEGLDTHCGDSITEVLLEWKPRGSSDSPRADMMTAELTGETWRAEMPLPDDGDVAQYHMRVKFADQSEMIFPDNRADPWFQIYRGDVMPLYCTDFESDPFAEGWVADGDGAWQWGVPGGSRQYGDPATAHSGTRVLGTGLAASAGNYPGDRTVWIESPRIDTGQWSDVRLHYRRWLGVEDGFYDQATIHVNGEQAWANVTSMGNSNKTQHHEDRAWVFNDVALSSRIFDKHVTVRWEIESDAAFELGGWNLDDVCIVANVNSVCGDGRRSPAEQCDQGAANSDEPDSACRTTCRVAYCGDGIVDSNEPCDDGNFDDDDACNTSCLENPQPDPYEPAGCCSSGTSARTALAPFLLALLGLLGLRRRRRE